MITTSRASAIPAPRVRGLPARRCRPDIFQNLQRRQPSGGAHDAAAWMSGRPAHIKVLNGSAELRVSGYGTQEEKLLQRELALKDVALAESELAFQVERREHLLVDDDVLQVRRIFGNSIDHVVAECFTLLVPVEPGPQLVRRI